VTAIAEQVDYLDFLITIVAQGRVIPVIGPELVTIERDGVMVPIDRYLAPQLAERLRLPVSQLPPDATLSDVFALHAQRGGATAMVPFELQKLLRDRPLPTPEPLKKLAQIRQFRMFVSLTFDNLLAKAIREVRPEDSTQLLELAYSPKRPPEEVDLPAGWKLARDDRDPEPPPLVFHLFGRGSTQRDFVLTEEDTLEWISTLQSESRRPVRLFDQLRDNNVLFVGCRFPDWLARFALRTTKGKLLSERREVMEFVADEYAAQDRNLTLFLDHFSASTKVFPGRAVEFVDKLVERWQQEHGDTSSAEPRSLAPSGGRPGSVFISYSTTDREEAEKLLSGLSKAVDVWMDVERLDSGVDWDATIQRNIAECSVFVPVLSKRAAARDTGYFRREWRAAVLRQGDFFGTDRRFILPVAVDDIPNNAQGIPREFWDLQVDRLPGGATTDSFRATITRLVRQFHERKAG